MMDLSERELMTIQAQTLFVHDENGRLRYVNELSRALPPMFFWGQTHEGNIWYFRHDLPKEVYNPLGRLAALEPVQTDLDEKPVHFERFRQILESYATIQRTWFGPAYQFPDRLEAANDCVPITRANQDTLQFGFAWLILELEACQPVIAVIKDGIAVSVCHSSRMSAQAAEAGVFTLEDHRGKGYASAVVSGWAMAVRKLGRIPLYSTSWDNIGSQSVARRLGLIRYGTDLHFT